MSLSPSLSLVLVGALGCSFCTPGFAQTATAPHDTAQTAGQTVAPGQGALHLSATLGGETTPARAGLEWHVFEANTDANGDRRLVAQSNAAQPVFVLPNGAYIVHVAYGFASQLKRIEVADKPISDRLALNAGAVEVTGLLGNETITPDKLSVSIYVPERGNSQAKLIVANAKPGQIIRLPEGMYHIVSTYLDTVGVGSLVPVSNTNSVVNADFRVQTGKIVQATLKHHAAVITLKLVNATGGEALANTTFTVLTPGGDVIRELIGAFPSLVLAEGSYIAIARHDGKTFQSEFKVQSAINNDVEVSTQ